MTDSVIKLFDRFTVSTAQGQGAMYSAWVRVPEWCQHAEMRIECHAFNNGKVEVAFETSMDQTQTFELWADTLDAVEVLQQAVNKGIGRYVRVKLDSQTAGDKPNMVLSAIVLFRTAA